MKTLVFDLETTNLRADIGTLIVASFGELKPNGTMKRVVTNDILEASGESGLAEWAVEQIKSCDIIIGHNSLAFDRHFLQGVMARYNMGVLPKRIHIDTMQSAKGLFSMGVSLSNLGDVFDLGDKDKPDKEIWRKAILLDPPSIKRLRQRCEEDVKLTGKLWAFLKPYYMKRYGR